MPDFRFYHMIEVRYADLDPQGHVNNAKYLTYLEQARIAYISRLGLWDGISFLDIGIILVDAHLTFHAPILFGQKIQIGVCVSRIGNKSLTMEYRLEDRQTGQLLASASTVLVTYDYHSGITLVVPDTWRQAINSFENLA